MAGLESVPFNPARNRRSVCASAQHYEDDWKSLLVWAADR